MTSEVPTSPGSPRRSADSTSRRLDSWKEIAGYLGRSVRAVQRWEKEEGLPVYRHPHSQRDSVWALCGEVDAWRARRAVGSNGGSQEAVISEVARAAEPAGGGLSETSGVAEARTPILGAATGLPLRGRSWLLMFVALAAAVGIAAWHGHRRERPDPVLVAHPLTTDAGLEWGPSLAPDGGEVVFARAVSGPDPSPESACKGLFAMDLASRGVRSVGSGCAGWARWSPDGQRIAFTRYAGPNRQEVVVVASTGGPEKVLGQIAGRQVAWTADGASLSVADREREGQPLAQYLLSLETGVKRRLTDPPTAAYRDTEASFSPDGKWLAFVRRFEDVAHLLVMPTEGGNPTRLTENEARIYGLDWTPDSQEIVYSADTGGRGPQLWRVRPNTPREPPRPIQAADGGARLPSLSRRGSIRLVYQQEDLDANIWGLDRMRDAKPQVWTGSTWVDQQPDLSPDGRTVAFASNRSGHWEIWLSTHSGSNPRPVTSSLCEYAAWPRWAPDGRRIAFTGRVGGKTRAFVVDADGGRVRRITSDDADESRPSWSHDGRSLYFSAPDVEGASQVWRVRADGPGQREQVTWHGGFEAFAHPEGRSLFFTRGRDLAGLWSLDLSTGLESPVVSTLRDGYWDVADDGVYYLDIHHADEIPVGEPVRVFRFASQRVETVAMVPTDWFQILPGFTVDRAGTRFLWNQIDQHTSDLMLIDDFR